MLAMANSLLIFKIPDFQLCAPMPSRYPSLLHPIHNVPLNQLQEPVSFSKRPLIDDQNSRLVFISRRTLYSLSIPHEELNLPILSAMANKWTTSRFLPAIGFCRSFLHMVGNSAAMLRYTLPSRAEDDSAAWSIEIPGDMLPRKIDRICVPLMDEGTGRVLQWSRRTSIYVLDFAWYE